MQCRCGGESKILETRRNTGGTRRRYRCVKCGIKWSTLEVVADLRKSVEGRRYMSKTEIMNRQMDKAISVVRDVLDELTQLREGL